MTTYTLALEGYLARLINMIEKLREARASSDDLEVDELIDDLVEEAEQAVAYIKSRRNL